MLFLIGGRLSDSQRVNRSMDLAPRSKYIYYEAVPTLLELFNLFSRTN